MNWPGRLREWNRRERGLPLLLGADLAVFCIGLTVYWRVRMATPVWPRPFHFPSGLMTVSMAMFAIAASFVMHVARRSGQRRDRAMAQRMMALALVGWATFLFLMTMEWGRLLLIERVTPRGNPWGVSALGPVYYGFTGYAVAHVVFGACWLLLAAREPLRERLGGLTMFVDFTNGLFVVIAFVVILSSTDLGGF